MVEMPVTFTGPENIVKILRPIDPFLAIQIGIQIFHDASVSEHLRITHIDQNIRTITCEDVHIDLSFRFRTVI